MSKNILIYLFGAFTASSFWIYSTGIANHMPEGLAIAFAIFSCAAYIGTLFGLIAETLNTLDKEK